VAGYNIYYSPTNNNNFELLTTLTPATDTSYLYANTHSIAGCFMVTSIDSGGLESKNPLQICVDNCPEYTLPNVFTPNGDGINDIFHPFPYSYIRDIDIKIFDRWGLLMFQTSDPDINWDGKNNFTHDNCSDGVYYYTCKVNAIHFNGVKTTTLKGFIELMRDK
jgi:gliding motility-associated-like protein